MSSLHTSTNSCGDSWDKSLWLRQRWSSLGPLKHMCTFFPGATRHVSAGREHGDQHLVPLGHPEVLGQLLAGWECDGILHQVVVVPAQAALQRHLGVRVEVGVSVARARDPRHVASLGLAGQVGLLLHRHEVHVARGVEPVHIDPCT